MEVVEIKRNRVMTPLEKKEIVEKLKEAGFTLTPTNLLRWEKAGAVTLPFYRGPQKVVYHRITLFEAYAACKLLETKKVRDRWALGRIRTEAQLLQEDESPAYSHQRNENSQWEVHLRFSPDELPLEQLLAHIWLLAVLEAKDRWGID